MTLDTGGFLVIGLLASQVFSTYLSLAIPWWAFSLVALALIFCINLLGIRIATRFQLILSMVSFIPLLILAVVIIAHGGAAGNTLQASIAPSTADWGAKSPPIISKPIFIAEN